MEKYLIYDFTARRHAREPVVRELQSGVLVCAFLTGGTGEPQNANVAAMSKSRDGGKTWTEPVVVVSHPERGCWATEIFTETDRPFMAVHTYNTNDWRREHYRELQTFRQYLDEDGDPLGEPISFPGLNGVSVRQGFTMSNGEWFFPVYWQEVVFDFDWTKNTTESHGGAQRYPFRCGAAVSGDGGRTFKRYGYLSAPKSLWEPAAVELEPGHIVMLMRSGEFPYLYRADSYDFGRTWTQAERTDIENAQTKIALFRIGTTVYLANNFVAAGGMTNRTHLEIRALMPDGRWKTVFRPVGADENFYYPHVHVSKNTSTVWLAFEDSRRHYIEKIRFDELQA